MRLPDGAEVVSPDRLRYARLPTRTRTTYDDTGRSVEYAAHRYRASVDSVEPTLLAR